jgi:trans-aconitate 2-methyltransferase
MKSTWDPTLYLTFGDIRTRAAADLLARIPLDAPARVADLGCGPGNSTALLRARYAQADIVGVDTSADMLADASKSRIKARWQEASFEDWRPDAPTDLIYANAAFQWSNDPVALVKRLFAVLPAGGVLAFQVPQNFDQPSHVEVRAAVDDGPWAERARAAKQYDPGFAKGPDYVRALTPAGAALDIWTTEYMHILDGPDPVFRFMSGTGLRPFVQALDGAERDGFQDAARARLARAYPPEADGRTLFPFRRLFVIAQKPG